MGRTAGAQAQATRQERTWYGTIQYIDSIDHPGFRIPIHRSPNSFFAPWGWQLDTARRAGTIAVKTKTRNTLLTSDKERIRGKRPTLLLQIIDFGKAPSGNCLDRFLSPEDIDENIMHVMSGRGGRKIRLFGMTASPTLALALVIPLAVFAMILLMGYQFVSLQTQHQSLIHPPDHPLHVIVNPPNVRKEGVVKDSVVISKDAEKGDKDSEPVKNQDDKGQSEPPDEKGNKFESIGTDVEYHIVFSTGCSAFQDWQSYVFFYQAMKIKQPGTVTRIVSGCDEEGEATLRQIFNEQIIPMAPDRFKIHFTPDFAKILKPGINYPYFNKPCGMKHWLETALGFPDNPQNEDAIVILLDPDQAIMRPFKHNDFSNTQWMHVDPENVRTQIMHGAPMGQRYGFALQWKEKVRMSYVAPDMQPSPVDSLSRQDASAGYVVGPPYIATATDMYKICDLWCLFAPRVHDEYPVSLAFH